MDYYDILSGQKQTKSVGNCFTRPDIKDEVINRIIWCAWKVNSLRGIHPWKMVILKNDHLITFWQEISKISGNFFGNNAGSEFFTKYYHTNFSYEYFEKNCVITIVMCVDKISYASELQQLNIFENNTHIELLKYETGKIVQNIENAIYNEGFAPYTLFLESQIPEFSKKIGNYLNFPERFTLASIISIFLPGEPKNFEQRPLETFIYEGNWNNVSGGIQECLKATSCRRFRFIFPKQCAICQCSIAKVNHFHDVERGLIYCQDHFFEIMGKYDEYNKYVPSIPKPKLIPKLCEHSIDCKSYSLYLPKLCSSCSGSMNSHFHDVGSELKYCYDCTHSLYRNGQLI